jgi:hypothetical protein
MSIGENLVSWQSTVSSACLPAILPCRAAHSGMSHALHFLHGLRHLFSHPEEKHDGG